jgi:hypothetical protein
VTSLDALSAPTRAPPGPRAGRRRTYSISATRVSEGGKKNYIAGFLLVSGVRSLR